MGQHLERQAMYVKQLGAHLADKFEPRRANQASSKPSQTLDWGSIRDLMSQSNITPSKFITTTSKLHKCRNCLMPQLSYW